MNDFEEKLKQALRGDAELSEDKLEQIRKETRTMYDREKKNNQRWPLVLTIAGFLLAGLWFWLFWQSDNPKFQILWVGLLIAESLGIAISFVVHLLIENNLTDRQERREIERQIAELKERLNAEHS